MQGNDKTLERSRSKYLVVYSAPSAWRSGGHLCSICWCQFGWVRGGSNMNSNASPHRKSLHICFLVEQFFETHRWCLPLFVCCGELTLLLLLSVPVATQAKFARGGQQRVRSFGHGYYDTSSVRCYQHHRYYRVRVLGRSAWRPLHFNSSCLLSDRIEAKQWASDGIGMLGTISRCPPRN